MYVRRITHRFSKSEFELQLKLRASCGVPLLRCRVGRCSLVRPQRIVKSAHQALVPPSMAKSAPVTHGDSSEAR